MWFPYFKSKQILRLYLLLQTALVMGQTDTTKLKEVVLSAALIKTNFLKAPTAISFIQASNIQLATPQLSLKEYLGQVPGLFAQNQYNYNQDLRIAIRGFGARAAFGIRGVQIIVDGIPETTPDGQGQLDNVPLGVIKNLEVLRGPSGALYGNAAGGVILINTLDSLSGQKANLRFMGGAFGLATRQATLGLSKKKWRSLFFYNQSKSEGYREQAAFKQDLFNAKLAYTPNKNNRIVAQFNITNSPYAEDPGGVSLETAKTEPKAARDANLLFDSSEKINHLKAGLSHEFSWASNTGQQRQLQSHLFGAQRTFIGRLPFENRGVSAFDRNYFGLGSRATFKEKGVSLIGFGHAQQTDIRSRFANLEGNKGALSEQQKESYLNTHVYINHKRALARWLFSGALRFDYIKMGLKDQKKFNVYRALNPNLSLGYGLKKNEFINLQYTQSFETPTLSEATNKPDGTLGLNSALKPISTKSFELIYRKKKIMGRLLLQLELAGFISQTSGEILPYEIEAFPGRQFFNNTGGSNRKGLESQWRFSRGPLEWNTSYTFATYSFESPSNTALEGKRLPGIPNHQFQSEMTLNATQKISVNLQYSYVGAIMANNINSVVVSPYQLVHLNAYKVFNTSWGEMRLFAGLNNITNAFYFDNIRINAFGGRFYEAAPNRNAYIGLEVGI